MTIPYSVQEVVWNAAAATATVVLKSEFEKCPTKVVEIIPATFSGTIDIQGKIWNGATYDNVSYSQLGQGRAQALSNDQLSFSASSTRARYLVTEPCAMMQIVMTRTAGTVTVVVHGWGVGEGGVATGGGTQEWQTITLSSGQTATAAIDLGADVEKAIIVLPDMTGVTASITASNASAGTYTTLDKPDGGGTLTLPKSKAHVVQLGGMRYIKVVSSATEGSDRSILVRGV